MRRSLLVLCIAVVVIALIVAPVGAAFTWPTKNPLPKGYPFDAIWNMLNYLKQNPTPGPTGSTGPTGPPGTNGMDGAQGPIGPTGPGGTGNVVVAKGTLSTENIGDNVYPPDPFSVSQCSIIVGVPNIAFSIEKYDCWYHAAKISFYAIKWPNYWTVAHYTRYFPDDINCGSVFDYAEGVDYTIICSS